VEEKFIFKEIENHLYKQALRIHTKYPNKCEIDELVNEVWIKGNIQKLDNIKYVSRRAYFDMIDYMRKKEGRDFMRGGVYTHRSKEINNMHGVDSGSGPNNSHDFNDDFFNAVEDTKEKNEIDVDNKDLVEYIFSCISEKDSNVLRKYYFEELTLKEIAAELNCSMCKVSKMRSEMLQLIPIIARLDMKEYRLTESQKKKNSTDGRRTARKTPVREKIEEILPEYVSDFEIDNNSAVEEEFILERDWS
jgi:RNA polymerase sigma factor (sigma-70 family)